MNPWFNRVIWPGWAMVWTLLVLLSYWAFHPYYALALATWPNAGMVLTIFALAGGALFVVHKTRMAVKGWMVYAFVLLLSAVVFSGYAITHQVFPEGPAGPVFRFVGTSMLWHGAFLLIALWHFALGDWLFTPLKRAYSAGSQTVLSLALGISVSGLLLFGLAAVGLLKVWALWPVVAIVLVWRRKSWIGVLRELFVKPIEIREKSPWTLLPLFLMFVGMAIAQVAMVKAFPMGFDGAALYMNTAHLLANAGTLPRPGQSFNWELFMSQGEVLFGQVPVSILLSHGAILFCLMALYRLGRLFMSRAAVWMALSLMFLNPAFSFHVMLDEKVDLGFLFIILAILLMVIEFDREKFAAAPDRPDRKGLWNTEPEWLMWAMAGWLAGYAFGIKYTGMLAIVGLATLMVYRRAGVAGSAGTLLSATGLLFLVGINQFAYLDLEGAPGWVFAVVSLVPGLGLLAFAMRRDPGLVGWLAPRLGLFALMALLNFLPWMVKHGMEHKSLSIGNLVQGKARTVRMDVSGFLERAEAQASLPDQMVIQAIRGLGVELRREQALQVVNVVAQYRFDRSAPGGTRLDQLMAARNQVIREILDDAQRNKINERLASLGMDLESTAGNDLNATYEMLVQNLSRRGLQLDEDQGTRLMSLLNEAFLKGRLEPGNRRAIMEIREELFAQILNPEQKDLVAGVRAGEYRKSVDGQRYRSGLFSGAQREEIKRYLGYEPGLPLYLSIPYDVTMNTRVPFSRYLDISFLMLLLLPFLLMGRKPSQALPVMGLALVVWTISVYSQYSDGVNAPDAQAVERSLAEQQGTPPGMLAPVIRGLFEGVQKGFISLGRGLHGAYAALSSLSFLWVYLILLVLLGGAFLLSRETRRDWPLPMKAMLSFGGAFSFLWFFMGNAIVWYGFPFFALLFLVFAWLGERPEQLAPEGTVSFGRTWWRSALWGSLALSLSLFFVSGIHPPEHAAMLYNSPFLKHVALGQRIKETYGQFMPFMDETIATLNADPKARVYRVGTYLNYHILRNDRRVFEDNQLGFYEETVTAMRNKEDFIDLLKESGFRYVLYDLNTTMVDKTPDKSLTRKANDFFLTLANSAQVRPIYTDNFIYDPAVPYTQVGKIRVPGKPGIGGENTMAGTFILFELL